MSVHKWNWALDVAFTHAVLLMMEADAFRHSPPAAELKQALLSMAVQFCLDEPAFVQGMWFGSSVTIRPNDRLHAAVAYPMEAGPKGVGGYLGRFLRMMHCEPAKDPLESTKVLYMNLFENWRRVCSVLSQMDGVTVSSAFLQEIDMKNKQPPMSLLRKQTRLVAGLSLFALSIDSDADVHVATLLIDTLTLLLERAQSNKYLLFWVCTALTNLLYPLSRAQLRLEATRCLSQP